MQFASQPWCRAGRPRTFTLPAPGVQGVLTAGVQGAGVNAPAFAAVAAATAGDGVTHVLGDIVLDDLRFQELVSEARTRIARHSPEWTEHNVSDPGITLIELFAWFTDILVYRVDRVPDRLHRALLELVGVTPAQPGLARAGIRFMLEPGAAGVTIPAGTEVAAPRTAGHDAVVFRTTLPVTPAAGELSLHPLEPAEGDHALLLGFERPLSGLVLRIELESALGEASASGPRPVWEVSGPAG